MRGYVYLFMSFAFSFEKLEVWQKSRSLLMLVYQVTDSFPKDERFGLISQMRRSCLSISSNLAEGSARKTNKDKAHFTSMAFSSAMEFLNQWIIAKDLVYISDQQYETVRAQLEEITNMLNGLRNAQLNK